MLQFDFHDPVSRRLLRAMRRQHCVTTPTSMIKRLTGEETWPDALTLTGGVTFGDGTSLGASGAKLVAVAAAATTLTVTAALHGNRTLLIASTGGLTITPPAATGTGLTYGLFFTATISGGNVTWDAKAGAAADVFYGWLQTYKATTFTPYITASNSNLMTFDGTTRGGIKGDWIVMQDMATNVWAIEGFTNQTGTIATPFSNH